MHVQRIVKSEERNVLLEIRQELDKCLSKSNIN